MGRGVGSTSALELVMSNSEFRGNNLSGIARFRPFFFKDFVKEFFPTNHIFIELQLLAMKS